MSLFSRLSDAEEYLEMWLCFCVATAARRAYYQCAMRDAEQRWLKRQKKQGDAEPVGDVHVATLLAQAMVKEVYRSALVNGHHKRCQVLMDKHKRRHGDSGWWLRFWEGICHFWPSGHSDDPNRLAVPEPILIFVAEMRALQENNIASTHVDAHELGSGVVRTGSGSASDESAHDEALTDGSVRQTLMEQAACHLAEQDNSSRSETGNHNRPPSPDGNSSRSTRRQASSPSGTEPLVTEGSPDQTAEKDRHIAEDVGASGMETTAIKQAKLAEQRAWEDEWGDSYIARFFPREAALGLWSFKDLPFPSAGDARCKMSPGKSRAPSDTITGLKSKIEEHMGLRPTRQRLSYRDVELDGERALCDYDITGGSTLYLKEGSARAKKEPKEEEQAVEDLAAPGSTMLIGIRSPTGYVGLLQVRPSDTVSRVKSRVEVELGIPTAGHFLLFNDAPLDGDRTLGSYRIEDTNYLSLAKDKEKEEGSEDREMSIQVFSTVSTPHEFVGVTARPSDTIDSVKSQIEGYVGIPADRIALRLDGSFLDGDRTLGSYNIRQSNILLLFDTRCHDMFHE